MKRRPGFSKRAIITLIGFSIVSDLLTAVIFKSFSPYMPSMSSILGGVTSVDPKYTAAVKQVSQTEHITSQGVCRYIEGDILNDTGNTIDVASISFVLLDSSGKQIGTACDNYTGLEDGSTWHFKASIENEPTASYKLSVLTGWN